MSITEVGSRRKVCCGCNAVHFFQIFSRLILFLLKKKDFGKDDGDDEDDEHDEEDDLYYWTDFMCISEHKHNKTNVFSTF